MADVTAIKAALAAQLAAIYQPDVQVLPHIISNPTLPVMWIVVGETEYDIAMERGGDILDLRVEVFVPIFADQAAQISLDEFLDDSNPKSVKAAIERERPDSVTWGGAVEDAHVTKNTGEKVYTLIGHQEPCLGAGWLITVET